MAGAKLNTYGIGDVDLTNIMAVLDACRQGYYKVSLTEWDTTVEPAIADGSLIEVNGALFLFDGNEAIGGAPIDGVVYIKLIPDGASITAEFTNDAPTWDDEKGGWYEPATNNRYLNVKMDLATDLYSNKVEFANFHGAPSGPDGEVDCYYQVDPASLGDEIATGYCGSGDDWFDEFEVFKPTAILLKIVSGATSGYGTGILLPGYYRVYYALSWAAEGTLYMGIVQQKVDNDWKFANIITKDVGTGNLFLYLYFVSAWGISTVDQIPRAIKKVVA